MPSVTTRQKPQAEARACIPCVSLLLIYSKFLHTLCFDGIVVFYVPAQEMFGFFVIFQLPVCMPVPHDFWAGLGMDGVVYGVGRPSLTSIFYTPYFASIAVFNIPACRIFSVFGLFHFIVFFLFGVVYTYKLFFFFASAHAIFD